jgi:hypothetical protein
MKPKNILREKEILKFASEGLSTSQIAQKYKISRTRVWQIIQGPEKSPNAIIRLCIMEELGNKCCKCGFSDARALQIDHIHGGGTQMKRRLRLNTPHRYYRYLYHLPISDLKKDYQVLCANCNWIKRSVEHEH